MNKLPNKGWPIGRVVTSDDFLKGSKVFPSAPQPVTPRIKIDAEIIQDDWDTGPRVYVNEVKKKQRRQRKSKAKIQFERLQLLAHAGPHSHDWQNPAYFSGRSSKLRSISSTSTSLSSNEEQQSSSSHQSPTFNTTFSSDALRMRLDDFVLRSRKKSEETAPTSNFYLAGGDSESISSNKLPSFNNEQKQLDNLVSPTSKPRLTYPPNYSEF